MSDSVKIETAHGTIEMISHVELRRLCAYERAWGKFRDGHMAHHPQHWLVKQAAPSSLRS